MLVIECRTRRVVNTDPQRRCYNGAHAKSELMWSTWEVLEYVNLEKVDERLKFWVELNDYAVSQRGAEAKREFRVLEISNECGSVEKLEQESI